MKINKCVKESFVVIGKEGSTSDGEVFVQKLWDNANLHFEEVKHLAKKDENGNMVGIWGAMSDFSRSFNPWEDFSKGLYLDGLLNLPIYKNPPEMAGFLYFAKEDKTWKIKNTLA